MDRLLDRRHAVAALLVLLAMVAAATLEGLVLAWRRRGGHDWRAFGASLGDLAGRLLIDVVAGAALGGPLLAWVHQHRIATLVPDRPATILALFFGEELLYYAYHRAAHRVGWFWATHCVHHSPNGLTLAAALRLGWTGRFTGGALFFAPLLWLGFAPRAVFAMLALNLAYQFWLHAAWMPRLGPLEWLLNTPAHHRVHHASNAEYLDCNYGGILIVFDRLFGSFVAERPGVPIRYGLSLPLASHNPLRIALHGWRQLALAVFAAPDWRGRLAALIGPPMPPCAAAAEAQFIAAARTSSLRAPRALPRPRPPRG